MPDRFISDSLFELNITLLRDRKSIAQPCGFIKVRTTCFPGLIIGSNVAPPRYALLTQL